MLPWGRKFLVLAGAEGQRDKIVRASRNGLGSAGLCLQT
jgi:hypothetical protein